MARQGKRIAKATDNRSRLQVDRSKTIAPTGRGKPITAAVATANIAKALYAADKKATAAAKSAGKGLYKAHTTTYKKAGQAIKAGAKALRPYTIFAKTKRAKSRVKK